MRRTLLFLGSLLLLPSTANAHTETGAVGGLISGFLHPLTGLDHVVAMVAVSRGEVLLAVMFPFVMSLGSALGVASVPFPSLERGIALFGVILGSIVTLH